MKLILAIILLTGEVWAADLRSITDSMLAADAVLADTEALAAWPNTDVVLTVGQVSSEWGYRDDPFTGRIKMHQGMDIGCPIGTPVRASGGGIVDFSGYSREYDGYGLIVVIQQGGATVYYAHLSEAIVCKGDKVSRGDVIGLSGCTGRSQAPHLHYETRLNGMAVDPRRFIVEGVTNESR
jgi:murein DD-endopeptidase MepM/ murein hydrolase activator NlpD